MLLFRSALSSFWRQGARPVGWQAAQPNRGVKAGKYVCCLTRLLEPSAPVVVGWNVKAVAHLPAPGDRPHGSQGQFRSFISGVGRQAELGDRLTFWAGRVSVDSGQLGIDRLPKASVDTSHLCRVGPTT